jgi:hypothetical protein
MAKAPEKAPEKPAVRSPAPPIIGAASAPFIYFDGVGGFGLSKGNVQLELAARVVVPDSRGKPEVGLVITAHLRCTRDAALSLQQAIGKALLLGTPAMTGPDNKAI